MDVRTLAFASWPNVFSTVSGWLPGRFGIERRVECATRRECQESVLTRSQEVLRECAVERADRVELVQVDAAEEIAPECSNVASLPRPCSTGSRA